LNTQNQSQHQASARKPPVYAIYESLLSFQGEGAFMGCAAFIIRFSGCDLRCSWCDQAATWHPRYKPKDVPRLSAAELLQSAREAGVQPGTIILLSGGEPALYRLDPIITVFRSAGFPTHIETAGHRPLPSCVNWITVSPKRENAPMPENIRRANEFRITVDGPDAIDEALEVILPFAYEKAAIFLQPEWSLARDPDTLNQITEATKKNPRLRAGYQLQKIYRSDFLDSRFHSTVIPLGGDELRGPSI